MPDIPGERLDKWLWQARFFRTRTLCATHVADKGVRINGQKTVKPAAVVRPGDVLTFSQGDAIRVVRVLDFADRRGPASVARALYEDVLPAADAAVSPLEPRPGRF